MIRAILLSTLTLGLLVLTGCGLVAQMSPPTATPATGPAATSAPRAAAAPATAGQSAALTASPKPSTAAAKPAASPTPAPAARSAASPTPVAHASPAPAGASRADARSPAVVATSAAALPAVFAPPAPPAASPAPAAAKPAAPSTDALGVGNSAESAAAGAMADAEGSALCGPGAILSTRASQASGRQVTIAIAKVEASYQPGVRGQPTFLNDAPYPSHVFTAVIWGSNRRLFEPALTSWQGKALCVTGAVEVFQQKPQIVVSAPSQLRAAH